MSRFGNALMQNPIVPFGIPNLPDQRDYHYTPPPVRANGYGDVASFNNF